MSEIETRWRVAETLIDGQRIAWCEVEPPPGAPPEVVEGLRRRALVAQGFVCPCGAKMVLPDRAARRRAARAGRDIAFDVPHRAGCDAWLAGWGFLDLGPWEYR